jgi:hypothetical protein
MWRAPGSRDQLESSRSAARELMEAPVSWALIALNYFTGARLTSKKRGNAISESWEKVA